MPEHDAEIDVRIAGCDPVERVHRSSTAAPLRRALIGFASLACAVLSACGGQPAVRQTPAADQIQPMPFRLSVGDEVEVKFYYTPELNEKQIIRPDGMISMQLIDDVRAGGLTVEELRANLRAGYAKQLKQPELEVLVTALTSGRIFVGGEVAQQGPIPLIGQITVSRAILLAQGLKPTAYPSKVLVIRRGDSGQPVTRTVNVAQILHGHTEDDLVLGSQDIVFVPRSPIAQVDLFVEQYIRQALPFSSSVFYNINPYTNTPGK
jgi:protein involved in polysaccharide export with SLBB domain